MLSQQDFSSYCQGSDKMIKRGIPLLAKRYFKVSWLLWFLGFLVLWILGFLVSWFLGLWVSWLLVSWVLGFLVSWFQSSKFPKIQRFKNHLMSCLKILIPSYPISISCSLEDIDPIFKIFKKIQDGSSRNFGARLFQDFQSCGFPTILDFPQ